jgi:hypothetical protein
MTLVTRKPGKAKGREDKQMLLMMDYVFYLALRTRPARVEHVKCGRTIK